MGPVRFAELDAVTLDAYGTLLRLADPAPPLTAALAERGIGREAEAVRAAFQIETAYYIPRSLEGRDRESLARLRRDCAAVFLGELEAELDPESFVDAYVAALRFEPEAGAAEALAQLHARGLEVAVVSNWDCSLPTQLERAGLGPFSAIVSSALAGSAKPDPAIFRVALARLGVDPGRALHVGDSGADAEGALAAGMQFARAPLAGVIAGLS